MEVVENYKFPKQKNPPKYDWDAILDGQVRRLKHGVDFSCNPTSMRVLLYTKATVRGGKMRIHMEPNGSMVVQFVKGVQS